MINVRGMHGNMTNANINDSHLMCVRGFAEAVNRGGTTQTTTTRGAKATRGTK